MLGAAFFDGGHRKTSASIADRSSLLNESTPVSPPALTILRRRSLRESSRTHPRRVHPAVRMLSVVSCTRAIAIFSASSALATETDASSTSETGAPLNIGYSPYRRRTEVSSGEPASCPPHSGRIPRLAGRGPGLECRSRAKFAEFPPPRVRINSGTRDASLAGEGASTWGSTGAETF
jgi:hypothetical protein